MMSSQKLHKAIRKNPIHLMEQDKLLTDELFGIVRLRIRDDNGLLWTTIYNPLNYSLAKEFQSHHESHGTFFYYNANKKRSTHIMLDHIKTVDIDEKNDILRKALKNYQ